MMKKFILIIGLILLGTGSAFALSMPRWANFPVNVNIQTDEKTVNMAPVVKQAFQTWQTNSGSILKFLYKNSGVIGKNAQIHVYFVNDLSQNAYYEIEPMANAAYYYMNAPIQGFYTHVNIKIRNKELDGSKLSRRKLYAISLQAVGRAMGVNCLSVEGSAMSCNTDFKSQALTAKDIDALKKVYRYQSVKRKN